MQLRKPAILLAAHCHVSTSVNPCASHTSTPPPPRVSINARQQRARAHAQCRGYATVNNGHGDTKGDPNGDLRPWPDTGDRHPTPYEVLGLNRNAAYSKVRFYELVKQYHPDRNQAATQAAQELMLERYRMIITAHTILSDPHKKKAYDDFGLGWTDPRGSLGAYRYSTTYRWRSGPAYQTPFEDDPMYNATWEDWERWYQRQWERERAHERGESYHPSTPFSAYFFTSRHRARRPVYLSNHMFISLVFLFAALGGVGQATRAGETARSRTDRLNLVNEQTTEALRQARQDSKDAAGEGKRNRIRRFVKEKEDHSQDNEVDGRVLRPGIDDDVCASGAVQTRDQPRFWEKPPER